MLASYCINCIFDNHAHVNINIFKMVTKGKNIDLEFITVQNVLYYIVHAGRQMVVLTEQQCFLSLQRTAEVEWG